MIELPEMDTDVFQTFGIEREDFLKAVINLLLFNDSYYFSRIDEDLYVNDYESMEDLSLMVDSWIMEYGDCLQERLTWISENLNDHSLETLELYPNYAYLEFVHRVFLE